MLHPEKVFMEARLGKPQHQADLGTFLENDPHQILKFDCVWDDTKRLYGDILVFSMLYYLADDTFEVLQVHEANNGRDQIPKVGRAAGRHGGEPVHSILSS